MQNPEETQLASEEVNEVCADRLLSNQMHR
jgi:hypothetical protein